MIYLELTVAGRLNNTEGLEFPGQNGAQKLSGEFQRCPGNSNIFSRQKFVRGIPTVSGEFLSGEFQPPCISDTFGWLVIFSWEVIFFQGTSRCLTANSYAISDGLTTENVSAANKGKFEHITDKTNLV